ncbi:formamidase [Methanofollis formosanus]|uniref:Formamidase n=1 Tax=Methanofollis formosanus TaxID=299308 RepID=A0A8G1A3Z3_9EURY|nr:acetamidase/formamidase family protein [Methanofollis formosanus]QYZ80318.1 formamidase [Methanofollis formosanus]
MQRSFHQIHDDRCIFAFGPSNNTVETVGPGSIVRFKTLDCFSNQITAEDQFVTGIDFSRVNPATGPVAIEGAVRGDALRVKILDIAPGAFGTIVTVPDAGVLGALTKQATTRRCPVNEGIVEFCGIRIPARPMVGVIGVAGDEEVSCGNPGRHGGNLDTTLIGAGATLYLPVFHEGGLLALGDVHAVMGDGEACVAACEVPAEVTVEVDLCKDLAPAWPVVETEDAFSILVSNEDLAAAFEEGFACAVRALAKANDLSWEDAYMLASLVVDAGVSQLVNPRKTVRVRIPKTHVSLGALLEALHTEA